MDQRVIKYYMGELSNGEQRSLLLESHSNPELKKEMMDFQNFESLMGLCSYKTDELGSRESYRHFIGKRNQQIRLKLVWTVMKYVAVIVICVGISWKLFSAKIEESIGQEAMIQTLTVPAGQRAHIILPDGTRVWVNAGSALSYPSVFGKDRKVYLDGEAFFEVTKNGTPFIVTSKSTNVKVLGTKFDIFGYKQSSLVVSLLQGSVKVYKENQEEKSVILSPNQQLTENNGKFSVNKLTENPIIWKDGLYSFEKQKLKKIIEKLNLYYDVNIIVKKQSLLNIEYTGKFRQKDGVMEVLRIIQKIHPFNIKREEGCRDIILY